MDAFAAIVSSKNAALSSAAGIYFEALIKGVIFSRGRAGVERPLPSVWMRNVQVYIV